MDPRLFKPLFPSFLLTGSVLLLSGCAVTPLSPSVAPSFPPVSSTEIASASTRRVIPATVGNEKEPERPYQDRAEYPELWGRMRSGFALPELESPDVERFAQSFAEKGRLEKLTPRIRRYLYTLLIEAEKRNLPTELALLPVIESGLNPRAESPAAAAGLCQFIPSTGIRFGLAQSRLVDQRKDMACVHAMYSYLKENADRFQGDWFLALAAYNWGEGAVARAVDRNARAGLPTDYLALRMPNETRAYVPQLLALRQLIRDPGRYGLELPAVENHPSIDCEVPIPGDVDVATAIRLAGISSEEFRQLNSGIKAGIIPRATHPTICLPFAAVARFGASIAQHRGPLASVTTYTVPGKTTLRALAKRYRITPALIRQTNDIPAGMRLRSGATVLVPKARGDGDIPSSVARTAQLLVEPDIPETRRVVIASKRNDTLPTIAKRHAVSLLATQKWNPGAREPLKPGQKLVLHLPNKKPMKPAVSRRVSLSISRSLT